MTQSLSQPKEPVLSSEQSQLEPKPKFRLLILVGLLAIGIGFSVWYVLSRPKSGALQLSGRIEGYPTDVGAKVGGRIEFVGVREGDLVRKGDVIVRLDDAEIRARLQGATARFIAAQQQERQARLQIDVVESQIQEAQLNLQQSAGDAKGRIFQAQSTVATAEAQLSQAEAQVNQAKAELKLASHNRDRFFQLVKEGAIAQQQFDQAQTTFETARATLDNREAAVLAARRQVNAAQGAFVQAQTTGFNPGIRNAQLEALHRQLKVANSQIASASAEVTNAQAARLEIASQLSDLKVVSSIDGVVITRSVEPGQVVTTGKTLLTLINPSTVYLRGYIPEGEIGKVRVGQKAKVFLDSAPDRAMSAQVAAIDTQASFTPENIYFREDRVKQVFGVKLNINNPAGFAKPGMPADGEILLSEKNVSY
ncbi:MAG: HlyD family efflux transporter periplasmic adaptor subunit [Chamaesiphon sp.]